MTIHYVEVSPRVLFREIEGEAVLLDLDQQSYFGLDEIGTRIWQLLIDAEIQGRVERVIRSLGTEYETSEEQLAVDVQSFLQELLEAQLISTREAPPKIEAADNESPEEEATEDEAAAATGS
ncbi:MAG: PqqD family protein [Acidobacteriota bacterium]